MTDTNPNDIVVSEESSNKCQCPTCPNDAAVIVSFEGSKELLKYIQDYGCLAYCAQCATDLQWHGLVSIIRYGVKLPEAELKSW